MAQITYNDKTNFRTDPSVAEVNKVTDANMNEIKQVVNNNDDTMNQLDDNLTLVPITINDLPTGTNYDAFYIPKFKMCFANIYVNSPSISAGTTTNLGIVQSDYKPVTGTALTFYRGLAGAYQVSVNASGYIRLFTENSIGSGSKFIISGLWYVE